MKINLVFLIFFSCLPSKKIVKAEYNLVDKHKAIYLAEQEWIVIFGNGIYDSKPFIANLDSDSVFWHVQGTMAKPIYEINNNGDTVSFLISVGGVPHALIRRKDGEITQVFHGK